MSEHRSTSQFARGKYGRQWSILAVVLVLCDALVVCICLGAAYDLRFVSTWLPYTAEFSPLGYATLSALSVPIWLGLFAIAGLYQRNNLLGGTVEYKQVIKACSAGVVVLVLLAFIWRDVGLVSRGWLVVSWLLACLAVCLERFTLRRLVYRLRRRGLLTARVLIVGANDQGLAIAKQWQHSATSGMRVIGFLDDFKPIGTSVLDDLTVVGRATSLAKIIDQIGVDEVVVVPNAVAWETFEEIITQTRSTKDYQLWLSPGFYEMLTNSVVVTNKSYVPLFTINEARLVGFDAILKVLLDYGLGLALCAIALPIVAVIALGLKLNKQPVFVIHRTIGQGSRIFGMLKFNTGAAAPTRLQRGLHRYGLDKLPQLFNVLAGHMSLVGPRPHVVEDRTIDPRQIHNLRSVKPGLIGAWLVSEFWTSADDAQDDLYYVRNWTIWLDLQIIFQCVLAWRQLRRSAAQLSDSATVPASPDARRSLDGFTRLPVKRGTPPITHRRF
jgi:lipopolysaccharide/colanic/teichoic acid biosynthesis glycosyltransferase